MQCLSAKSTGFNEFSSNIATALVCLATNRTYNFSKMIFDGLVKNINNKVSKFWMYPRFLTMCLRMAQFVQIAHTQKYVVPFHTKKLFTTLRVNSPSFSGRIVPLFDSMIIQQGEGSGTPTKPHHTPSQEAQPSSLTSISSSSIPTVVPIHTVTQSKPTPLRQYTQRVRIAQSSTLSPVADEPASPVRDISEREAFPTDSGFIADQDRETIAKSSTLPHDTAPRVTSPAAVEGNMQQTINELTTLCTSLQRQHSELLVQFQAQKVEINKLNARVKILEDNQGVIGARSADDAPIKGRRIEEEEGITRRVSSDTEEIRIDERDSIPTVGPPVVDIHTGSDDVPTAKSDTPKKQRLQERIVAQVARELKEQQEKEDKRMTEQIARDTEVERFHAEEELQGMIDSLDRTNETIAKYLQEYQDFASELPLERRIELISDLVKYQDNYSKIYKFQSQQRRPWTKNQKKDYHMTLIRNNLGWKVKDFKGMTFKEIEAKFAAVWKLVEDFIPMGSKEEVERLKRKGFNLEQEKAKKLKTSEEVPDKEKSPEEIPEKKVKEIMQLVPIEEVVLIILEDPDLSFQQKPASSLSSTGLSSPGYQALINMTSLINSNLELKNMFGQFMKMNTASSSSSGTLPSNTITNLKEDLKGITTRSGNAYKGPTIPTTTSPPKVVERETEVTKDTVPPTNNGSTKDVQPSIVQIETPIPNSKPVVAPVAAPVVAPVSAPKSRLYNQKLRDKANDQREKFFKIFKDLDFNISFMDALILMPKVGPTIKSLLTTKEKLYELARTPLNEHCSAVLLKKLPKKLGDLGKFLIQCDFLGMDECLALADLGASINLMPLSVWNKLSLLK
nr:reverse transcriptase domain-containing protein [Tanacetum cinerariifolium]